jgi:hypothetical protein
MNEAEYRKLAREMGYGEPRTGPEVGPLLFAKK